MPPAPHPVENRPRTSSVHISIADELGELLPFDLEMQHRGAPQVQTASFRCRHRCYRGGEGGDHFALPLRYERNNAEGEVVRAGRERRSRHPPKLERYGRSCSTLACNRPLHPPLLLAVIHSKLHQLVS